MKTKMILFYAILVFLGGCIPIMSINPFYTKSDLVFEQKLVGTWVDDLNEPKSTWQFSQIGDPNNKTYIVTFTDEKNEKGLFTAHLVKLQDKLFLDIFPAERLSDVNSSEFKYPYTYSLVFMIPVHTILKVDSIEPQLLFRLTDDEKFMEFIKENPDAIEYSDEIGRIILTSPTKDLKTFILKYAGDEKLFPNKIELERKTAQASKP